MTSTIAGTPAPAEAGAKGRRTRGRLLDAAVRRFAADGFRRTSLSDIARDAGVSPAAAYAYFDGKEALFEAAVDADAAALIGEVSDGVAPGPVRDGLATTVALLLERLEHHPLARRVLSGLEPDVVERLLELPSLRAYTDSIADDVRTEQRTGTIRRDLDPPRAALGLESIVLSLLMAHLQARVPADSPRVDAVLEVLDAALRPPSEE